jgi:hypothetical protein
VGHDGAADSDQGKLLYAFDLDAAVPADHLVREIDRVLDPSWGGASWRPVIAPSVARRSIRSS